MRMYGIEYYKKKRFVLKGLTDKVMVHIYIYGTNILAKTKTEHV